MLYLLCAAALSAQPRADGLPGVLTVRYVEADPVDSAYSYALCTISPEQDLAIALLHHGVYRHHIRYRVDYSHMVHTGLRSLDFLSLTEGIYGLEVGFGPGSCGADFYSAFWFKMGDELVKGKLLTNSGGEANSEYGYASVTPDPMGRPDYLALLYAYGENVEAPDPPYESTNYDYYIDTAIYRLEEGTLTGIDFPDLVKMRVTAPSGLRAYDRPPMQGIDAQVVAVLPFGSVITVQHRSALHRTVKDGTRTVEGAYVGYRATSEAYAPVYFVFDGYLERVE